MSYNTMRDIYLNKNDQVYSGLVCCTSLVTVEDLCIIYMISVLFLCFPYLDRVGLADS